MKVYDLHTHTLHSDGKLSVEDLINRAKEKGVDVLSITDHDTIKAYQEISELQQDNLHIIPGIEFSTYWKKIGIHILGLNLDLTSKILNDTIQQQLELREQRAIKIVNRLNQKHSLEIDYNELKSFANTDNIGRPHIAEYLIEQKKIKNFNQAFDKYLSNKKLGEVKYEWLDLETIVKTITKANGIAVIAHPLKYKLTRTKLIELITDFKTFGGKGIEIVSGRQDPYQTKALLKITQQQELYGSCGSDFHTPTTPWSELGKFEKLPNDCMSIWELFN